MTCPARPGRLAALALTAAGLVGGGAVAVRRQADDDADRQARAAHAEFIVTEDARDRAEPVARDAAALAAAAVGTPDEPVTAAGAASAVAVAREAGDHADRLRAEWGERWRRLGLGGGD